MDEHKRAKRLHPWQECAGTVDGLRSEDGILIADLSSHLVALPEEMEPELRPYLGRRIAVLRSDSGYHIRELPPLKVEQIVLEVCLNRPLWKLETAEASM